MTQEPDDGSEAIERERVHVADLAARMDKRLYTPELTEVDVRAGAAQALQQGVGAVLTRPEHLEAAAEVLQGSSVGLATALAWYTDDSERLDGDAVKSEAADLVNRGATEVAYSVTKARLSHHDGREVSEHVALMTQAVTSLGARARVVIGTEDLSDDEISRTCSSMAEAGAWMVQGGSWRGHRAALGQIETIRAALPQEVLVKWTSPVRTISTMLLCISMGVDRFNCDVDTMLADATRSEWLGPLLLPIPGVDY